MKKLSILLLMILLATSLILPLTACNMPRVERVSEQKSFLLTSDCIDQEIHKQTVEILKERFLSAKYRRRDFSIILNENGTILVTCRKAVNIEVILSASWLTFKDSSGYIWLNSQDHIKGAYAANNTQDGGYMVVLEFTERGAARFADATNTIKNMSDKTLSICLGDTVISAPQVNEQIISTTAQITGNFTYEEALDIASAISSGRIPIDYTITILNE